MKLSTEQKKQIQQTLQSEIKQLKAIYLFGSYVDGSANKQSDIDLAFLSDSAPTAIQKWEIANTLANLLGADIDLVDIAETDTIFRYQIISTGERLYGSGYELEAFETQTYGIYLHFQEERKPILDAIYADRRIFHNG